jgi:hypothetical protein
VGRPIVCLRGVFEREGNRFRAPPAEREEIILNLSRSRSLVLKGNQAGARRQRRDENLPPSISRVDKEDLISSALLLPHTYI